MDRIFFICALLSLPLLPIWAMEVTSDSAIDPLIKSELGEEAGRFQSISSEYFRGIHLIYNCSKAFWACVDRDSFQACQQDRAVELGKKLEQLSCVPLQTYTSYQACTRAQQQAIHQNLPIQQLCRTGTQR